MEHGMIDRVKACFTIPDAWRALNLPGDPGKSCRCPWRQDRRPSFSVWQQGRRWKDHATGTGGDVIDFVKEAAELDTAGAVDWCAVRAGLRDTANVEASPRLRTPKRREPEKERKPEPWPNLRPGTLEEREALATLRGFSVDGIALAERRGLLFFGIYDAPCRWRQHWHGLPFWAVTDGTRRLVELRRLDGLNWPEKDGTPGHRKAHSIGHGKDHPVGLREAADRPVVALCEGMPDAIAAHELALQTGVADRVGVCAVLGAGVHRLATAAVEPLRGKHVRIFPHCDEHGMKAAREWAAQINEAGAAVVDAYDLNGFTTRNGQPGKDLADLCNIAPAELRAQPEWILDIYP